MSTSSWPSDAELNDIRKKVSEMVGSDAFDVRVAVSPYRICPLGAHIDHQGGTVTAMTINKGILLGFISSNDCEVVLRSGEFSGEVRFRIDEIQQPSKAIKTCCGAHVEDSPLPQEECNWGRYARGAAYALQRGGNHLSKGIIGYVCGYDGLDSSGLSSSAAVGVAYLLALENANGLVITPIKNVEYDRLIENEYLGLKNGILDQSAILLSSYGCLMCMNCKTKEHNLIYPLTSQDQRTVSRKSYKILLALSGLKHALMNNPGYNHRVAECQNAAKVLLRECGDNEAESILSSVDPEVYEAHKEKLDPNLAKRAEHYFSENMRVMKGIEAWALGNLEDFGKLVTASGLSSIQNYECGAEPLVQLYEILSKAPGVFGARFSGAGFRGCCMGFVDADLAAEAASYVSREYLKLQPELASKLNPDSAVLICEPAGCAYVI